MLRFIGHVCAVFGFHREHRRGRAAGLSHCPAVAVVPAHPDTGLPLVPAQGPHCRREAVRRDAVHGCPEAGQHGGPHPPGPVRRRYSQYCRLLPRLADRHRRLRDVPGFCKTATLEEIRRHGHVLTPGRYVGTAPQEDDGEPFQEKMVRLTAQWREQQEEAQRLDAAIAENLARLGFLPDN